MYTRYNFYCIGNHFGLVIKLNKLNTNFVILLFITFFVRYACRVWCRLQRCTIWSPIDVKGILMKFTILLVLPKNNDVCIFSKQSSWKDFDASKFVSILHVLYCLVGKVNLNTLYSVRIIIVTSSLLLVCKL